MAVSRTAQYVALYRALESCEPRRPRLFEDPFANAFLPRDLTWAVRLAQSARLRAMLERYADFRAPGARSSAIARTRFIDDRVRRDVAEGSRQLVILGAGYDCRAHRLSELKASAVFEVDRAETQERKRRTLRHAKYVQLRSDVHYVPLDLLQGDLPAELGAAGWRREARTTFLCEGVSNYLSEAAVVKLLELVAAAARESTLIFSYIHRGVLDGSVAFDGTAKLLRNVQRLGEPWSFGLLPARVGAYFDGFGLTLEEDLGADEYRRRYLDPQRTQWDGYSFYRIAVARSRAAHFGSVG
jgi:methyltransferase (TIGR00027 family)